MLLSLLHQSPFDVDVELRIADSEGILLIVWLQGRQCVRLQRQMGKLA